MLNFSKKEHLSSVFIASATVVTDDHMTVDAVWQSPRAATDLDEVLVRSITKGDHELDAALRRYAATKGMAPAANQALRYFAFTYKASASGTAWHHGSDYSLAVKGAPEQIIDLCDLSDSEREQLHLKLRTLSNTGLHVIALATGVTKRSILQISELHGKEKLGFVGFITLRRDILASARRSNSAAATNNVRLYLASGRHPTAVYATAHALGLVNRPSDVFDAHQLDVMNADEVQTILRSTTIFARANSEHKQRLVEAIKTIDPGVKVVDTTQGFYQLLANKH